MNYTDTQLKHLLANILPDKLVIQTATKQESDESHILCYKDASRVLDTELLHLCWLVEETLTGNDYDKPQTSYNIELCKVCGIDKTDRLIFAYKITHATWQQRVIALCKVKGIEI